MDHISKARKYNQSWCECEANIKSLGDSHHELDIYVIKLDGLLSNQMKKL